MSGGYTAETTCRSAPTGPLQDHQARSPNEDDGYERRRLLGRRFRIKELNIVEVQMLFLLNRQGYAPGEPPREPFLCSGSTKTTHHPSHHHRGSRGRSDT